jgi:hypothetical protein
MPRGRTRWEAQFDKRRALEKAESSGQIADSLDYRTKLMERVHAGEITPDQAQAELKAVKRSAKKNGLLTRSQAFSRG